VIVISALVLLGGGPPAKVADCRDCHIEELAAAAVAHAHVIPAFSRKYRTSCSTCHTAAPKLNVLGEAFRLNGYRFPKNDALLRKDAPVPLGEDPWKDLWPRAIWPGELPGTSPIALRIQSDAGVVREAAGRTRSQLRMPHELYLLGGATLGDGIGVFAETEWSREEGLEVVQAKVEFQNVLGIAPARMLNLWVGRQNLYLFTFADRQIDHAGRESFRWQTFRPAELPGADAGSPDPSEDEFSLIETQPAVEINGLLGGRISYGLGVSQGAGETTEDNNGRKDAYYRVRWKLGGLGLDGEYPAGYTPPVNSGGQLLDRALILEHFGYLGAEPAAGGVDDEHRHFGVAARALLGRLDAGAGYVWGRYDDPWGTNVRAGLRVRSLFAKVEYLALPWLMPSLKVERFDAETIDAGSLPAPLAVERRTRIIPGAVALIRQNVRGVIEAEFLSRYDTAEPASRRPAAVWLRLDVAF
jgi:hypothetical protein